MLIEIYGLRRVMTSLSFVALVLGQIDLILVLSMLGKNPTSANGIETSYALRTKLFYACYLLPYLKFVNNHPVINMKCGLIFINAHAKLKLLSYIRVESSHSH